MGQPAHLITPLTLLWIFIGISLTGCTAASPEASETSAVERSSASTCPLTQPLWTKPPEDAPLQGQDEETYFFVNEDRSIWANVWWIGVEDSYLHANPDGVKVGWLRPAGAEMQITGQRLDADAPPLETDIPCCYPARFQPAGLAFPTEGCWEVTAEAADSKLSFVVWVEPAPSTDTNR